MNPWYSSFSRFLERSTGVSLLLAATGCIYPVDPAGMSFLRKTIDMYIYIYRIDWISQKRQRVPRGTSLEEYFFFVFPLLFSFVSRYVTNIKIRRVRFFSKKRFSPNFYGIVKILVETCFGKARKNTVRPVTRTVNVHAFLTSSYCHFNGVFKASNRSSRGGPSRASFPI